MSTHLGNVTLLSRSRKEYAGALYDEPAGLTFRAHNKEYLTIPWENMSQWGWGLNFCNPSKWRVLLTVVCAPLLVATSADPDPSSPYVYILIGCTDSVLYGKQNVVFKLGNLIYERRAKSLVDEITTLRAGYLRERQQKLNQNPCQIIGPSS